MGGVKRSASPAGPDGFGNITKVRKNSKEKLKRLSNDRAKNTKSLCAKDLIGETFDSGSG